MTAGMILDVDVLLEEIERCSVRENRLMIDAKAAVLDESDRLSENAGLLGDRVGSTLSGTGAATARKVLRDPSLRLARHIEALREYVGHVSAALNDEVDRGSDLIVEGTQGFGLSLHHAKDYPFATSRDTTAAAFLSEAGLSPLIVSDVYMVLRTFPIRVAGNSGPLRDETTWERVTELSGYPTRLAEFTTVTKKLRRIGSFDWDLAREAARVNRPTGLALHGADYLDYRDLGQRRWDQLTNATRAFIEAVEEELAIPVLFVFTGPAADHIIDRRETVAWASRQQARLVSI
jgi:adenylosuccinate synthase